MAASRSHIFCSENQESAVEWGRRCVHLKPEWYQGHVALIASLVEAGRLDESRAALTDYLAQCPGASLAQAAGMPFRHPAHRARFMDALR